MSKKVYLVSVSGGKDSMVTWHKVKQRYGDRHLVIPYFADTNWERQETYNYLKRMEKFFGQEVQVIKSKKYDGFEDLCIKKTIMPSRVTRFCTQELKIIPSEEFIQSWQQKGYKVINCIGIRREEGSITRIKAGGKPLGYIKSFSKNIPIMYKSTRKDEYAFKTMFMGNMNQKMYRKENSVTIFQPILELSTQDIFFYHNENNIEINPLYKTGATRVGCGLCIHANVQEVGMLPKVWVDRVTKLEQDVEKASGFPRPFFHLDKGKFRTIGQHHRKHAFNTLGLELGCFNKYGACE